MSMPSKRGVNHELFWVSKVQTPESLLGSSFCPSTNLLPLSYHITILSVPFLFSFLTGAVLHDLKHRQSKNLVIEFQLLHFTGLILGLPITTEISN